MIDKIVLLSKLKPYIGSLTVLKYNQGTKDIITELLKNHKDEAKEYDKIYPYFLGKDLKQTCKNIFDFLKKNVKYTIEPSSKQTLKSPSSILVQGYGDCKQYSQFIGGILDAINRNKSKIDWTFRFSSYNDEKVIQHVFVVAKDKNGNEIWIDPVLKDFNVKKPYKYKIDKKPKMALYKISGFDNNEIGKIQLKKIVKGAGKVIKTGVKIAKPLVKVAKFTTPAGAASVVAKGLLKKVGKGIIKKVAAKAIAKGATKGILNKTKNLVSKVAKGKLAKVVIKVGTVPARNAFLSLVLNNKGGLATKLGSNLSVISPQLKTAWESLGGKFNTLQSTILKGSKAQISGICNNMPNNQIGAIDAAKLYTTALPVIKKLEPILNSVEIDVNSFVEKGSQEALNTVSDNVALNANNDIVDINKPNETAVQPIIEPQAQQEAQSNTEAIETDVVTKDGVATLNVGTQSGTDYKKFLIPAAIAAGAFLLLSKRK